MPRARANSQLGIPGSSTVLVCSERTPSQGLAIHILFLQRSQFTNYRLAYLLLQTFLLRARAIDSLRENCRITSRSLPPLDVAPSAGASRAAAGSKSLSPLAMAGKLYSICGYITNGVDARPAPISRRRRARDEISGSASHFETTEIQVWHGPSSHLKTNGELEMT